MRSQCLDEGLQQHITNLLITDDQLFDEKKLWLQVDSEDPDT